LKEQLGAGQVKVLEAASTFVLMMLISFLRRSVAGVTQFFAQFVFPAPLISTLSGPAGVIGLFSIKLMAGKTKATWPA
jgi:hypothetical protein